MWAYADDIFCANSNSNLATTATDANINAKNVSIWLNNHGLQVNPKKCEAIYFNNTKKKPKRKITINNTDQFNC